MATIATCGPDTTGAKKSTGYPPRFESVHVPPGEVAAVAAARSRGLDEPPPLQRDLREVARAGVAQDRARRRPQGSRRPGRGGPPRSARPSRPRARIAFSSGTSRERAGERDDEQVGDGHAGAVGRRGAGADEAVRRRARRRCGRAGSAASSRRCSATTAARRRSPAAGAPSPSGGDVARDDAAARARALQRAVRSTAFARASARVPPGDGRRGAALRGPTERHGGGGAGGRQAVRVAGRRCSHGDGPAATGVDLRPARPRPARSPPPRRRSGAGRRRAPRSRPSALSVSTSTRICPAAHLGAVLRRATGSTFASSIEIESCGHRDGGHAQRRSTAATTSSAAG